MNAPWQAGDERPTSAHLSQKIRSRFLIVVLLVLSSIIQSVARLCESSEIDS